MAKQGIMSAQAQDEAETSLQAAQAAVNTAKGNVAAAEAELRQAKAHELLTQVSATDSGRNMRDAEANARALAEEARVEESYAQVESPIEAKWMCGRRGRVKSSLWALRS